MKYIAVIMAEAIGSSLLRYRFLKQIISIVLGKRNVELSTILAPIGEGDIVFDIGANSGGYTVLFASLVSNSGHVHSFEPIPTTCSILIRNLARTRLSKTVKVNNMAAGAGMAWQ